MSLNVTFLGLGYIGLPTAAMVAQKKIKVVGVDINHDIVNKINKGEIHIIENGLQAIVQQSVNSGYLKASTELHPADIYLIVVPTPFKENNKPDISFVQQAIESIMPHLKKNDLVIIESTSPVGTTELMASQIFETRSELRNKIFVTYCPERVLPGNIIHELEYNDRVIGGINEESTQKAIEFYKLFVKGELHPTNARTAEMVKLTENASRDNQIAFANELSIICDKANIDVWELIELANKHPRVNILQPGCGVGGHCIAVDPYFITSEFPEESNLIAKAREINNFKATWVTNKIRNSCIQFELKYKRKTKLALFGLTFKPNIDDLRESPAQFIAYSLWQSTNVADLMFVEPNIKNHAFLKLTSIEEALKNADIIAFLVKHNDFLKINIDDRHNQLFLDFCGIAKKKHFA